MGEGTVVVRRRALGDVVLCGAITEALPRPVTFVTDQRYVPLVARMRGVDRAMAWGESRPTGRVLDLQRDHRSVVSFPVARRLRKHSVARRLRLWGFGRGRPPVTELYARAAGVVARPPPWFDVAEGVRDTLALLPGASSALKAPATSLLAAAGRGWPGPVVVLGGPGEEALVSRLVLQVPGAAGVVEDGFERTLAALGRSVVALGGDSGLAHLAVACGARSVVLAGPTHPDDGFLVGPGYTVLGRDLGCRPCALHRARRCRRGDHACAAIELDRVLEAVWCAGSS